ncbi:MAG: orotidine 5'-phosphate decarboxylase, partial [Clostridiales bacterium]
GIVDAVCDLVPAVKPQIAFYEKLGVAGMAAYKRLCDYANQKGLIVIADAKRGDIGSTSAAYADSFLAQPEVFGERYTPFYSDFLTVNPYLGSDCLNAFVENGGETIYWRVAQIVERLSAQRVGEYGYSAIGSVVGATYPEQSVELRKTLKTSYFLVPGYGAQGATAADIMGCFDENGLGAIVNSSRGIIFAYQREQYDDDYQVAARQAVIAMQNDINEQLKKEAKWYGR